MNVYVITRDTDTYLDDDSTVIKTNTLAEGVSYMRPEDALERCERLAEIAVKNEEAHGLVFKERPVVKKRKDYVYVEFGAVKKIFFKVVKLTVK